MKRIILAVTWLAAISLGACTIPPTQTAASNPAPVQPATRTLPETPPTQTSASDAVEEAEVKAVVENFGKRLQNVSLQAPDAAQEMQKQYSEFVSLPCWKGG